MITHKLGEAPENTQETILLHMKKTGRVSVQDLCDVLGITAMAVRRHLTRLQKEGLVECKLIRQSRGRPSYRYFLSDKAESLFPKGYQTLAEDLLDAVYEQSGHGGVMALLTARNQKRIERLLPRVEGLSLAERVEEVSKIFSEEGYMTEWEKLDDGNFFIFQRNCALHDVAAKYRQVCGLEPHLMESLLGVKVAREKYMMNDDPVCGYLVRTETAKIEEAGELKEA